MKNKRSIIQGILVDNLDMNQALDAIQDMGEQYLKDQRSRYVATINVDFLVNTLSMTPGRAPSMLLTDAWSISLRTNPKTAC